MSLDVVLEGGVLNIAIDRPEVRNALAPETVAALSEAFARAADPAVRAIVLAGRGGAFSSGLDLRSLGSSGLDLRSVGDAASADPEEVMALFQALVARVVASPVPTVALVDGPAVGFGCSLALACDLRVATPSAYFQQSFVRIGLIPDGGATYLLPRLIGVGRALEMMMLGERVEAEQAQQWGLLTRLVVGEEATQVAQTLASRLANGPKAALARIKAATHANLFGDLEGALKREQGEQMACFAGAEFQEGVQAFLQKRDPRYREL